MGIKNLAFCEVDISYPAKNSLNATMEVLRWEKIDLGPATRDITSHLPEPQEIKEGATDAEEDLDPYSVGVLSRTAYGLVKKTILSGAPDVILIEKQRWRSGGGSAVQQWTLRVNTLEGMLWAVLETFYTERLLAQQKEKAPKKKLYDVFSVDPKRVGNYWLGQSAQSLAKDESNTSTQADAEGASEGPDDDASSKKKVSRFKAEKKAKIALLRSWLSVSSPSTTATTSETTPTISFNIGPHAEATRKALCSPTKTVRAKKREVEAASAANLKNTAADVAPVEIKKLDDITDCFLQAAAWVSWESNRLQLKDVWTSGEKKGTKSKENKDKGEDLPELDDGVLLEMVRGVQGE